MANVAYRVGSPSFPDASNTGPAAGTVFTVTSGDFQTTSNGQVVQNRQINGGVIDIRHINVTVQDCIVNSTDFVGIRTTGAGPFTGCLIERCRIVGSGGGTRLNAIQPDAMTSVEIRFCDISGFENGIAIGADGMNIHDNYIHDLSTGGASPHVDGIQGGGGFTSLTVNHNTIISWDTSCIILQNESGAFSGAVITNNKLIIDPALGGSYCILCQKRDDSSGLVSNITVTGNRMSKGPTPGASYGFFHNVTSLTWSDNVEHASGVSINPDRLMAIALVSGQIAGNTNTGGASTTLVVTLPNNPAVGNLVCVAFTVGATVGTMSCADSNSNSYTLTSKTPFAGTTAGLGLFYLQNVPANGTKTITITSSASVVINAFCGWAVEFSGAHTSAFENDATANSGANNTAITTPSYTSLNDGDLFFSCAAAGDVISTANSPWTGVNIVRNGNYCSYTVKAVAGAQAINYTQGVSSSWSGIVAAFKVGAASVVMFADQARLGG